MYLHRLELANGSVLDSNPMRALQQFHTWKAKRLLKTIYDDDAEAFRAAVDSNETLLIDLFMDDGRDLRAYTQGQGQALPGITLTVGDIANYVSAEGMP